jgi:alpha-glucosidase (family GH31 glycosyl hydrolase)
VLFYRAHNMPKHQWQDSNATFPEGGYLHAKKGGKDSLQFDVRRQDVRDWWSGIAGKAVHDYGYDGIFVDGATAGVKDGSWSRMFGAEQAAAMDEGVFVMLQQACQTALALTPSTNSSSSQSPCGVFGDWVFSIQPRVILEFHLSPR